jgi:AcrR family transcriptional regulator
MSPRQPPTRPRRGERRLITRAHLLDAAERVFAREGFRGASVDAIALEAGYSSGALYSNFKGKEDLFLTLVEERIDPRLAKVYEALETELASGAQPLGAGRRFMEVLGQERDAFLLLIDFWGQAVRDRKAATRYAERHGRLRAIIVRVLDAAAGGRLAESSIPAEQLSTLVIALANGFVIERLADPGAVPDDLFGQAMGALLRGAGAVAARPDAPTLDRSS